LSLFNIPKQILTESRNTYYEGYLSKDRLLVENKDNSMVYYYNVKIITNNTEAYTFPLIGK